MRCEDELIIRIKSNGNVFVEDVENGIHSCKTVDSKVFINCIRNSIKTSAVTSGIMPAGSFHYSVSNGLQKICIEFLPRRSNIVYEKTEYKDFPLPRLVFGFSIHGERIVNVNLGVVGDGLLTPKTKMYVYPFSNVSGFRLCCGANRLPDINSLHQLTGVMHYIMSMPNNNDHYNRERTRLDLELRHLFETLKDKKPQFYYTNVLVDSGKTLHDFVNI